MFNSQEIRQKFLNFFKERNHVIVPSSSLIPDDPSVLLTTAGMQQFKRYFTGELNPERDFGSKNTASVQKCFRTSDIEEVGDESHLTFFEMLGNFSFGGYFKEEAIEYAYDFITKELGLKIDYVSIFIGDSEVPADEESENIWRKLGVTQIQKSGREDNFWGPTGIEGPCGPTTEIYVNSPARRLVGKLPIEVWNIVFNEYYYKTQTKQLTKLQVPGVDTGMGFERLLMIVQNKLTIFETDVFAPLINLIKKTIPNLTEREARILADHLRGSVFLIADGVLPSNKEAGYILRRLLRRIIAVLAKNDVKEDIFSDCYLKIKEIFGVTYSEIQDTRKILAVWEEEKEKFEEAIKRGIKEIEKYNEISGADAFYIYETFGLPFELIKELARAEAVKNLRFEDFEKEFKKHQEISRAGAEKKFGGHGLLLDTGELKAANEEELNKVLRLHTATHLLQQALREILGSEVRQMGSDITPERTRFDFSFPRKLSSEELRQVEELVNQKIKEDLPVNFVELPKEEAEKTGALHFFRQKYPEIVKVYYIGSDLSSAWSKEFCGGPHVKRTSEIGRFKIVKEESVGAGVRRIRGVLVD